MAENYCGFAIKAVCDLEGLALFTFFWPWTKADWLARLAGNGSAEVAIRAQQLLEHSLLSELRAVVARALSGLDMFAGSELSELDLLGSSHHAQPPDLTVRSPASCFWGIGVAEYWGLAITDACVPATLWSTCSMLYGVGTSDGTM